MLTAPRPAVNEKALSLRCAIYTRKSSEEGLAQEFNSLDAQREAAEAYILSQRHTGWIALAEHYDDGGYTGANLERPALRRLLADIEAGAIDCVLVYKVDRLSRSLLDFARLMGIFEQRGVSLVSVTQQFNTTASLGRLTLNILLSFAQFEREIIAERTRDKMSAARRKGKWVGGIPALGYDVAPGGGKLVVNEEEAQQVRVIFTMYLEHGTLSPVLSDIQGRQWTTKRWITKKGRRHPGRPFVAADVLRLLTNRIYTGRVHDQGQIYPGEHTAIVEEAVWQRVNTRLEAERPVPRPVRSLSNQPPSQSGLQRGVNSRANEPGAARGASVPAQAPRISRLLALATKFEGQIQQGLVQDYAELARLGQVSRSRVTQIMNLLNLAPDIQEEILFLTRDAAGKPGIREASIRRLGSEVLWSRQRQQWRKWFAENKG
jgi:DNA invertase Pin-like site-specific DNA recombinase